MKLKTILLILAGIAIAFSAFKITQVIADKKLKEEQVKLRKELIKNDSLIKINKGLYTKLVADTLTIKQLKKKSDSLELELKNPKVVVHTVYKFKEVEKPIDGVVVKDSMVELTDAYPDKENPFISYIANINLITGEGIGKFTITPLSISLGIGQNPDGTYRLNTKVPDFMTISSIDVQALPMELSEPDNFGWLVGAGIGKDFRDNSNYLTLSAGIRVKKVYLEAIGATNQTISAGFKFEF